MIYIIFEKELEIKISIRQGQYSKSDTTPCWSTRTGSYTGTQEEFYTRKVYYLLHNNILLNTNKIIVKVHATKLITNIL